MYLRTVALCIVAGLCVASSNSLHAVLVDGYHLTGPVLADNFVIYTGSPSIDFTVLEEGYLASPTPLANASRMCPLKNRGDENCDGDVDHGDLGFWASRLSALTYEAESMGSSQVDYAVGDIVTQATYVYIAAWTHPEGDGPGVLANLRQGQPVKPTGDAMFGEKLNSKAVGLPTTTSRTQDWNVCSTALVIDPQENSAPSTDDVRDAIDGCNSSWKPPTAVPPIVAQPPAQGFGTAQTLWDDGSAENGEVVLLRHRIVPIKSDLSIRVDVTPENVMVTVDPYLVEEFELTLQFNPDQLEFDENAAGAGTAITPFELTDVQLDPNRNDFVTNIRGGLAGLQQFPFEVDIFTITFNKRRDLEAGEEIDLRVFTEGDDFVMVGSTEPEIAGTNLAEFDVKQAALGAFEFDLDRDNQIGFGDIDVACTYGDDLTDILAATGTVYGDVNFDSTVTFADFLLAAANIGQGSLYSAGDVDCNGQVDVSDTQIILANVGQGAAAAVPEPSASSLVIVGWLLVVRHLRRRL